MTLGLLLLAGVAAARPGGGGSFSGGSRGRGGYSGGGGSGGGGGDAVFILFWLLFEHPVVGVPLILILAAFFVLRKRSRSEMTDWSTQDSWQSGVPSSPSPPSERRFVRRELERLRTTDPNFSLVLIEDFLYALYAEVHTARGQSKLERYSAFLSAAAIAELEQRPASAVTNIVIGAMTFTDARGTDGRAPEVAFSIRYESNYTDLHAGREQSYYVREEWWLTRKRGVVSRAADRARLFVCPSCGAPLDAVTAGTCAHCGKLVQNGEFDWVVAEIQLLECTPRVPMLTGDTEEEGTDEPTIVDPAAPATMRALLADDSGLTWESFEAKVALIFNEFQVAWSARDLTKMRGYLSDRLFEAQVFWVDAYKAQGLRNVTENAQIEAIELARVSRDRFFDAVTVRLWATSLDYTIADKDGRVVAGSRHRERRYSEYWTLIRSSSKKGPTRLDRVCPNCGAPLDINMAGVCKYCQAKVTAGDFDWVLSRIEQDAVYGG
jgi:hypothetical protein